MKKSLVILTILVLLKPVLGSIVIQEVLYDPATAESGGEAVLLYNQDNVSVDVSGWTIATAASSADATLPPGTVLLPKTAYLIADSGWESNKNPEWPSADHEETMQLKNSDSGVALRNSSGADVDAVGWGAAPEGFYQGTPHNGTKEGKSLLRMHTTGDNAHDFAESEPVLYKLPGVELPIVIIVNGTEQLNYADIAIDLDKIEILDARPGETRIVAAKLTNKGNSDVQLALRHNIQNVNISISKASLAKGESAQVAIEIRVPSAPGRYEGMLSLGAKV